MMRGSCESLAPTRGPCYFCIKITPRTGRTMRASCNRVNRPGRAGIEARFRCRQRDAKARVSRRIVASVAQQSAGQPAIHVCACVYLRLEGSY